MDTGFTTRKDGWFGHTESVFDGTSCLFGFCCEYSPSPNPHSKLYSCHTRCTRRIHDIRVEVQDGIQYRRQPANTSAGTMGQTPSETDRQDTLSKHTRPIQHCALESSLITTCR